MKKEQYMYSEITGKVVGCACNEGTFSSGLRLLVGYLSAGTETGIWETRFRPFLGSIDAHLL